MSQESIRILLIEDEPAHAELVRRLIERSPTWRAEVVIASAMAQAKQLLVENKFDVVLSDLNLPDSDEPDTVRDLLEFGNGLPIIVLTSASNSDVGQNAVRRGLDDFLVKSEVTVGMLQRSVRHSIDRVKMRARLKNYARDLERSNRDLDEFARIVSHDLKSPLAVISLELDQIDRINRAAPNSDVLASLVNAREEIKAANTLIEDVLALARASEGEKTFEDVSLHPLVDDVMRRFRGELARTGGNVIYDGLPVVRGNPTGLGQVMQNLIGNAVKYATVPDRPLRVELTCSREGDCWNLSVLDNGPGIPPEHLERVFDMFNRAGRHDSNGLRHRPRDRQASSTPTTDASPSSIAPRAAAPSTSRCPRYPRPAELSRSQFHCRFVRSVQFVFHFAGEIF